MSAQPKPVWTLEDIRREKRLTDPSPEARKLLRLTTLAYEKFYQRSGKWDDLNPMTRAHWLDIAEAVLAASEELA